ncbi:MAG: anhydro-N-acetylmuramic acid kinase [Nitrospirae bacterium RIFCSPLOWO2_02_FULL_62_14]|nr:MAG: anhydro-N-acetylmuramic acid kinase [Nitrospirae bacterium RIFCSPLOWO2_02_FULL_62_14]OGW68839.1 MAG: anhydro-N-acetylmuramic acid kinase [Nitrospirae bacterium RIFCSPLOWO2_01_FULL_62_17]
MKVVGLMSGTSGDGVDAVLVDIRGTGHELKVKSISFVACPYPANLQQRILAASARGTVSEICHLNVVLGEWFARAALRVIKQAGLEPAKIDLVGSHGQTIHHLPNEVDEPGIGPVRSTLQIAEPAVIAERTGIPTVANFRPRDMAAGGQGAPLTPYVHSVLLRDRKRSRLVVNLGGIGNVTYLPAGKGLEAVLAFDTGPGNMAMDGVVRRLTKGRETMDRNGRLAAKGKVAVGLLAKLLAHPYVKRAPPKSTGREEFGDAFVEQLLAARKVHRLKPEDLLATCSLFTAITLGSARRWLGGPVDEVIVGGGGVRNRALMSNLSSVFSPVPVRTFESAGWESKAFEAVAFAVLAYQTFHGTCANVPAVTGATHPVVLGTIVPGRGRK